MVPKNSERPLNRPPGRKKKICSSRKIDRGTADYSKISYFILERYVSKSSSIKAEKERLDHEAILFTSQKRQLFSE